MAETQKREMNTQGTKGLQITDLILVAVLVAAGAVLKLVVGMLFQGGVKPNFMIASYCLAMLLIRPQKVGQGAVYGLIVGLIVGAVSQIPIMNGTPFLNFVSEGIGGAVIGAISATGMKAGNFDLRPSVGTFVTTFISGSIFSALAVIVRGMDPMAGLIQFAPIVIITAIINTILVQILFIPLKAALKKN